MLFSFSSAFEQFAQKDDKTIRIENRQNPIMLSKYWQFQHFLNNNENSYNIVMKSRVLDYAKLVFQNDEASNKWLTTENPALNNNTPTSLLETKSGCEKVLNLLANIQDANLD
jgi:putative toxin-antitoxin system antitoxin component (TIGR02293 family)